MIAWQLKDVISLENAKSSKGTGLYVNMMLIFATLQSTTDWPFISKGSGLTLGKNKNKVNLQTENRLVASRNSGWAKWVKASKSKNSHL